MHTIVFPSVEVASWQGGGEVGILGTDSVLRSVQVTPAVTHNPLRILLSHLIERSSKPSVACLDVQALQAAGDDTHTQKSKSDYSPPFSPLRVLGLTATVACKSCVNHCYIINNNSTSWVASCTSVYYRENVFANRQFELGRQMKEPRQSKSLITATGLWSISILKQ